MRDKYFYEVMFDDMSIFVLFFESCPRRNAFKSFWWNSA